MKTPPNKTAFESAPDKRDYNNTLESMRILALVHPDCVALALLVCLLLWWCI